MKMLDISGRRKKRQSCSVLGLFYRGLAKPLIGDVQSEALPVIEETMSHSRYRKMLLVGTASDRGSEFERIWQMSDMKEWDPKTKTWIPRRPENRAYPG